MSERVNFSVFSESIVRRTIENIVAAYAVIVRKIEDSSNGYGEIPHKSPEEVNSLESRGFAFFKHFISV